MPVVFLWKLLVLTHWQVEAAVFKACVWRTRFVLV